MSNRRIIGIVLLVIGVVVLVIGLNASDSIADTVSETFTGRLTRNTMLYIVGGIAMGIAGLFLMLYPSRS